MSPTDPRPGRRAAVLLAAALLAAGSSARADAAPVIAGPSGQDAPATEEPIERLEQWPRPADAAQLGIDVTRLRKAATREMVSGAREGLFAEGAAAAPKLLAALGRESDEDSRERIVAVLERITGAPHTRLLAREFASRSPEVRRFALRRAARFPDAGVREMALAALAKARAVHEKAKRGAARREAGEDLYAAALCGVSAGSLEGLDVVIERAQDAWGDHREEIHAALTAVRGAAATRRLAPLLESGERRKIETALRLLAACGDPDTAVARVRGFLDADDNSIRVAAINALRGIVDGAAPLPKLPVFEAIERASAWKRRLG